MLTKLKSWSQRSFSLSTQRDQQSLSKGWETTNAALVQPLFKSFQLIYASTCRLQAAFKQRKLGRQAFHLTEITSRALGRKTNSGTLPLVSNSSKLKPKWRDQRSSKIRPRVIIINIIINTWEKFINLKVLQISRNLGHSATTCTIKQQLVVWALLQQWEWLGCLLDLLSSSNKWWCKTKMLRLWSIGKKGSLII